MGGNSIKGGTVEWILGTASRLHHCYQESAFKIFSS